MYFANQFIISLSTIFILLNFNHIASELITASLIGAAFAAGAGGWYKWDTIADNTVCRYMECCNAAYVPYDLSKLKHSISKKLYGQPLVEELIDILNVHKEAVKNKKNQKALVISLHGWTGVGKNFAATMIAEALFQKGMHSKYVKLIMGAKDFDCSDLAKSQANLVEEVKNVVKKCPTSLVIIDEIHDMCPSVLDALRPMLDHHHAVDGVDFRDAIFIFIANTGGEEISTQLLELYNKGFKRNEVKFHYFEPIIRRAAYHTGGFKQANAIANHLIDYYIPFLPLEQQHVEMCARTEFILNDYPHPSEEMMEEALAVVTYGPTESQPIFANNGCKRFNKQVPYVIKKFTSKEAKSEL